MSPAEVAERVEEVMTEESPPIESAPGIRCSPELMSFGKAGSEAGRGPTRGPSQLVVAVNDLFQRSAVDRAKLERAIRTTAGSMEPEDSSSMEIDAISVLIREEIASTGSALKLWSMTEERKEARTLTPACRYFFREEQPPSLNVEPPASVTGFAVLIPDRRAEGGGGGKGADAEQSGWCHVRSSSGVAEHLDNEAAQTMLRGASAALVLSRSDAGKDASWSEPGRIKRIVAGATPAADCGDRLKELGRSCRNPLLTDQAGSPDCLRYFVVCAEDAKWHRRLAAADRDSTFESAAECSEDLQSIGDAACRGDDRVSLEPSNAAYSATCRVYAEKCTPTAPESGGEAGRGDTTERRRRRGGRGSRGTRRRRRRAAKSKRPRKRKNKSARL